MLRNIHPNPDKRMTPQETKEFFVSIFYECWFHDSMIPWFHDSIPWFHYSIIPFHDSISFHYNT
jgi:hypothetical protein